MSNPSPLESIYFAALAKPAEERAAFLDQMCGRDPQLRQKVERMLAAQLDIGSFLERPAVGEAVTGLHEPEIEHVGKVIGPYKLLQQIGEGGMGAVYMAEQTEPVVRKVALKIIKSGMDTRQVIARFEAERQALALMDHPNIAKILDAGTYLGRPYFVMELVKGVPIVQYCDEHRLTPTQRLELFVTVCHAVQHAHQKGIIHRDLKPTNILVADYDDRPVAKVIDFGVAKAIGQELTEKTMFTQFGQMVGTLEYMSPEQAKLNQLDIDTRSDIYSLGVLLYELLTGTTPFGHGRLQSAAFDEMLRIIREEEPEKPSTRLSTTKELPSIAASRQLDPKKLTGLMKGELDWVVMKSLEKDRGRRYETANAFVQDIERYLHDEPVAARATSSVYRIRKTIRRNRLAFTAAAAVLVAVIAGGVISTWQAIRATRSEHEQTRLLVEAEKARAAEEELRQRAETGEKQARTEATKSQQVAKFMQEMLNGVAPWVAMGRDTKLLRDIVDSTSQQLDKELADQPAVEADLLTTLGNVYSDLGEKRKGAAMFRRALELRQKLYGPEHVDVAKSLVDVGLSLFWDKKYAEAEALHKQALAIQKKLLGNEDPTIAVTLSHLADDLTNQGRMSEAQDLYRTALDMNRKLVGDDSLEVAKSLLDLGDSYHQLWQYDKAEPLMRESLAIYQKHLPDGSWEVTNLRSYVAWMLELQKKYDEAEPLLRHAAEVQKKVYGHLSTHLLYVLGRTLHGQGKETEAEDAFRQCLTQFVRGGPEDRIFPELNYQFAEVLWKQRKFDEAEAAYRRAIEAVAKEFPTENSYYLRYQTGLIEVLIAEGKMAEAETTFHQLLADDSRLKGVETYVPVVCNTMAIALRQQGKFAEAESAARQSLAWEQKHSSDHSPLHISRYTLTLAEVLADEGKLAEAEASCRLLLDKYRDVAGGQYNVSYMNIGLTNVLQSQGRLAEAEEVARQEIEVQKKLGGDQDRFMPKSLIPLASVLLDEDKLAEAEKIIQEAIARLQKRFGNETLDSAKARVILAGIQSANHQFADAEENYRQALSFQQQHLLNSPLSPGDEYFDLSNTVEHFSNFLREQGQTATAEIVEREILAKVTAAIGEEQPLVAEIKEQLAQMLLGEGKVAEAEPLARQALELQKKFAPESRQRYRAENLFGQCLLEQEKYTDAEPPLQSGYEGMEKLTHGFPAAHGKEIKQALRSLTKLSKATGQSDKAAQWQQKLTDLEKSDSPTKDVLQTSSNQ
ncbi:MAG TPA: tetratricopeptide repeat protein [Pirellulales bacterium]|jgi:serine/threonine protein kinase|nr:tetratricopeptide repeat protein [Pirellulales bacterium]